MAYQKRVKLQVDTTDDIKARAKAVAYSRGKKLNEFVLEALADQGDTQLTALIKKDLAEKQKPGRPLK